MYANKKHIKPLPGSEFPADLQVDILQIKPANILQPVLDIGCGCELNMVKYLQKKGIETHGIDRFENNNPFYIQTDWLEYNYVPNSWGTIISNLGFSSHFFQHSLYSNENFHKYKEKYMEILLSLKAGGSFYYSPHLPFIEKLLDKKKYCCTNFIIEGYMYKTSRVTKI